MKEIRTYNGTLELRAADDPNSRKIVGHAAVFEQLSEDMGWRESWYEVIDRNAFDDALQAGNNTFALFNHDANNVLASTDSGTLDLSIDDRGLRYEFDAPNTTLGNDLLELIRRGDIRKSSFAFTLPKKGGAEWIEVEGEPAIRRIKKIARLYDVSPVTYPAYEGTDVAKRELDEQHDIDALEAKREQDEARKRSAHGVEILKLRFKMNENI